MFSSAKSAGVAFGWFQKAADQGHADGQTNLAFAYMRGVGTIADHEKAIYWYKKAATAGSGAAQLMTGLIYMSGELTEPDLEEAHFWLSVSTAQGHKNAARYLRRAEKEIDPSRLATVKRRSKTRMAREFQSG